MRRPAATARGDDQPCALHALGAAGVHRVTVVDGGAVSEVRLCALHLAAFRAGLDGLAGLDDGQLR
jgi:hypothetical protein